MRSIDTLMRRRAVPSLVIACVVALAAPASAAQRAAQKVATGCRAGEASFFRDEGLSVKVATKLKFAKPLMRERINAKVSGGVATLTGGVTTQEQIALAGSLASQVEGITCVNNLLKLGPVDADDPSNPRAP